MAYAIQNKVAVITLWNLIALLVHIVAFGLLVMKVNRNQTFSTFMIAEAGMMIWLVGKVFKTVSPTAELRWTFIVFYYFGICLLEAGFLDFAYCYNKGRLISSKWRRALYAMAFIQFLVVLTNPLHYLFYSVYGFWGDDFGPLFYFHMVINYTCILAGLVLCSLKFQSLLKDRRRAERFLIGTAILVPIVLNIIYVSQLLHKVFRHYGLQIFDITPISFTMSILVFVYATFRYEFFGISPLMRHQVVEGLATPVCILSKNMEPVYRNGQFVTAFSHEDLSRIVHHISPLIDRCLNCEKQTRVLIRDRQYHVTVTPFFSLLHKSYVLCFNDVTAYHTVKEGLEKSNRMIEASNTKLLSQIEVLKETSRIGARNFVARELHDIIGHSLVVTMRLLEVAKINYEKGPEKTEAILQQAVTSVVDGRAAMEKLMTEGQRSAVYTKTIIEEEVRHQLEILASSGIDLALYVRGHHFSVDETVISVMKKVLLELSTNSLKHSECDKIFLSMTFERQITLQYMDNGVGCDRLVKGNGLLGIESRLEAVKGKAKFSASPDEGFQATVMI